MNISSDLEKYCSNLNLHYALCSETEFHESGISKKELEISNKFNGPLRRVQFCLGRYAAHSAIRKATSASDNYSIGITGDGLPIWPNSLCGSISHCRCYTNGFKQDESIALALVAKRSLYKSLGVDIEHKNRRPGSNVAKYVGNSYEQTWISQNSEHSLLSFISAKEALYKAVYPIYGMRFGFLDAELSYVERASCFEAKLLFDTNPDLMLPSNYTINIFQIEDYLVTICALTS